jgi:hypothetical protein
VTGSVTDVGFVYRKLLSIHFLRIQEEYFHVIYTKCPGRNVPDFGKMFLKLKYTYITVTEIMAREKCGLLAVPRTVPVSRDVLHLHCARPSFSLQPGQAHSRCDFITNRCHIYSYL